MSISKLYRVGAVPVLTLGLAAPILLSSGCGADDLTGDCAADISARFEALSAAVAGLVKVAGTMKGQVAVSCAAIANDLGATGVPDVGDGSTVSDDDMQAACTAASASLQAELDAGVTISVAIEGGKCEVNAQAQFSCEASCDVNGECSPGSIEVSCDPGELSGECSGNCKASATCQGSASVEAQCSGSCSGVCNGTCDGQSSSAKCAGRCEGSCTGDCVLAADASISCGANVDCKGGCDVAYTAPHCEGEITPPSCNIDADCEAGCQGQAKFEATCTPPSVVVEITGGASANLQATLTANLPNIYNAFMVQGELVITSAGDVATAFGAAAEGIVSAPACALKFGGDFAADISGAASASVSVNVSVSASADVGGKAGG